MKNKSTDICKFQIFVSIFIAFHYYLEFYCYVMCTLTFEIKKNANILFGMEPQFFFFRFEPPKSQGRPRVDEENVSHGNYEDVTYYKGQ